MKDNILGPNAFDWMGTSYNTTLSSKETDGRMSIVDSVSPAGYGPPRHIHKAEDEALVVLSGEIECWLAGETRIYGPGTVAFIPRGVEHTFRVIGEKPSRHLIVLTPGGFEGFFAEMSRENRRIPEDMEAVVAAAERYNLEFTGPPLGAE